jgi:hypothetical protein
MSVLVDALLREYGVRLDPSFLEHKTDPDQQELTLLTPESVLEQLAGSSIKRVGAPFLSDALLADRISGLALVQLVRAENLDQPSTRQESLDGSNRTLGLTFTDGYSKANAVELVSIPSLTSDLQSSSDSDCL